ncbi:MAG: diheme cytochrome c [Rhizobium sp.]
MTTFLKSGLMSMAIFAMAGQIPVHAEDERYSPVTNERTKAECSACHMAYPAGLLPQNSWKALMTSLPNHFGEDASLDEVVRQEIEDYLVANALDANGRSSSNAKPGDAPMRISEMPWFAREHGPRLIARAKADEKIGSISNCAACHRGAEQGYFEDD